jgi:hypothetical protein
MLRNSPHKRVKPEPALLGLNAQANMTVQNVLNL